MIRHFIQKKKELINIQGSSIVHNEEGKQKDQ